MVVSVLIVTYNSSEEIADCLDAVLAQEVPGAAVEVVVVDSGSTDDTRDVVRRYADRVKRIDLPDNVGFAAGMNTAFEASGGELVALVNPDCVPDPGCLAALAETLAAPGIGVAAALLRNPDGSPQ